MGTTLYCVRNPVNEKTLSSGAIELRVRIFPVPTAKRAATKKTTWDSLVTIIAADDMDTIRDAEEIFTETQIYIDTIRGIPSGSDRCVNLFTKTENDTVVHETNEQVVSISTDEIVSLSFWLQPICGSVYVSSLGIPTTVDSVHAYFISNSGDTVASAHGTRSSKLHLSLDYIPDGTEGTLIIEGTDDNGVVIYRTTQPLTFDAGTMNSIDIQFTQNDGNSVALEITIVEPGVTTAALTMESETEGESTCDSLIISEIMYMANDSEYVELYNCSNAEKNFTTLIIDIDGTNKSVSNISIPAQSFYLLSRYDLSYLGIDHSVISTMNLSSTTGNWLTLRDENEKIIDRVAYAVKSNDLEWPYITSQKHAIVLDSLCPDPEYNNFGRRWQEAESYIDQSVTQQKGTPGAAGR
jgi:hypothetical protein